MIDIFDERIERLDIALRVGKHSKRMANMQKLRDAFIQYRTLQVDKLNSIDEGSNARKE